MLSIISTFFSKNKLTVIIGLIALLFYFTAMYQSCVNHKLKQQLTVADHNIKALNDSIRITIDKQGKEEANKLALLTDKVSNLEKLNTELYAEVKNIKGKVSTIIKTDIKVLHDTVPLIVKAGLVDSTVRADFSFDTTYSPGNFRKLSGYTKYSLKDNLSSGTLTRDELGIKLVTGIKNLDKGKPEIFIKSDYPGLSVSSLDGAVLDPNLFKRKRSPVVTTGINIGWTPVTYDISQKKFSGAFDRFGATVGININIIKLLRNE